jgi:hypothetical protein
MSRLELQVETSCKSYLIRASSAYNKLWTGHIQRCRMGHALHTTQECLGGEHLTFKPPQLEKKLKCFRDYKIWETQVIWWQDTCLDSMRQSTSKSESAEAYIDVNRSYHKHRHQEAKATDMLPCTTETS